MFASPYRRTHGKKNDQHRNAGCAAAADSGVRAFVEGERRRSVDGSAALNGIRWEDLPQAPASAAGRLVGGDYAAGKLPASGTDCMSR
ncbi:hypothetical protein [Burkholderia stabilis]